MSIKLYLGGLVTVALVAVGLSGEAAPTIALDALATLSDDGIYTLDSMNVTLFWTLAGFATQASASALSTGLDSVAFSAKKDLSFAKVSSKLLFGASPPEFRSFQAALTASVSGVELGYLFFLAADYPDSYHQLLLGYKTETLAISGKANFGLFPLVFQEGLLSATWAACPSCDLSLSASLLFTKEEGFEYLDVLAKDLPLPCPGCTVFKLFFDAKVTYTTSAKTVVPTVRLKTESICADLSPNLGLDWDSANSTIRGILFTGWSCKVRFPGDIIATLTTTFDEGAEFFETYSISGPTLGCCGLFGKWFFSVDFRRVQTPPTLFGWGRVTGQIDVPLLKQATVSLKLVVRPESPVWSMTVGLKSLW